MRPVACFPNSLYGLLIMLALPLVGEMFTVIGFATVPAATWELPQPSTLRLSDLPRQMVADSLMPRELNEFMRAARYEHQQLSKLRQNTIRRSPWSVQVKTSEGTTWLDPAEDEGWDQVEEILEANPRCLEQRPPSGKGLLERLPLPSWKNQALQAAKDETEPPYLKILSRLLSFKLASIGELTLPPPSSANLPSRRVKAAQTLLSMSEYLWIAWNAARDAALNACNSPQQGIVLRTDARNVAYNAASEAARVGALNAANDAAKNAASNAASDAASDAALNDVWAAAWFAARDAVNEAITRLVAQSPADAPPSAELIGKTAYRSAELTAQLSMLKQAEAVVQRVFARTERYFSEETSSPVVADPAVWKGHKNQHFSSADENIVHYWQPWLLNIDQFVDVFEFLTATPPSILASDD